MAGPLHEYLSRDHTRLAGFLARSPDAAGTVNGSTYDEFRSGLLKHIALEEKILFPAVRKIPGGRLVPMESKIRLDHGAIAALLVPPPTAGILAVLRAVLTAHHGLEENPGGVYEQCEEILAERAGDVLRLMHAAGEVPVHPYNDAPGVIDAVRRAVMRAGYDFDRLYA